MYKKRRGKIVVVLIILILIALLVGGFYYFISTYSVKTVYVEGNVHYTQKEIENMVMQGPLGSNSMYLSWKYRDKGVENIPFVDVMNVEILSPDTIKIVVYEKALAGYIEFMDSFIYFDRDGYMVETSNARTIGIPQVSGLKFQHVVLGEKIPVENDGVFETVMSIANLLDKYEISAEKIYFQSDMDIVLYIGELRVMLGKAVDLEEKIMVLPTIIGYLDDTSGVLHLENYTEDMDLTIFEVDKTEEIN
ncbi:MAG: FtsQ-type POTRA domain-containing protein [Lachnospiraceae bacterium]|nr:FtsQ-type POTRA domain-containing protein [Lachnospiraceae bacterium]